VLVVMSYVEGRIFGVLIRDEAQEMAFFLSVQACTTGTCW
jgi:hypothetical protein